MRIEFHKDPSTGAIIAGHASNGAILGTGWNEHLALADVIESARKALDEIDPDGSLNGTEQEAADHLFDAIEGLRVEGYHREREEHPDSENLYNDPMIQQSIEEDRK